MLGRTDSRLRMVAILLAFLVFASAAGLRLGYWQVVASEELTAQVLETKERARALAAAQDRPRADIVDRDGQVLAKTVSYDSLDAYANIIAPDDHEAIVATLAQLLDLDAPERTAYLEALATGDEFVRLQRKLTLEQSTSVGRAIADGLLPGITLTPHPSRSYPSSGPAGTDTTLASQLIGFVRADGRGGSGVEGYYQDRLTTVDPGSLDIAVIGGSPLDLEGIEPPPLRLTIDSELQRQVEKDLYNAFDVNRAKSASAIVMDPHTGAILASASVPSYDANDFATIAVKDQSRLRNPVVSDQYEPGSVMKIFTVTAALAEGKVTPNTMIRDQAVLDFYGDEVNNADMGSLGLLAVKDVIAESRNVATAKIARRLAPSNHQRAAHYLYDMWRAVGLTEPTGIDLAAEAGGTWWDPDRYQWAKVDLANRSFGQGVAATLVQLARGYSTIVNGGHLVRPHVVADVDAVEPKGQRVLTAKVARQAKDILRHVTGSVTRYAEKTLIPGFDIGGKTGTGQIWDPTKWNKETKQHGAFKPRRYNHSFVGFVRGRKQEVVIAVRLEEPVPEVVRTGYLPLKVESTELFRSIAYAAIEHLGMKKLKDPDAGRPIIGTKAARDLDPVRDREARRLRKLENRREERKAAAAATDQEVERTGPATPAAGTKADKKAAASAGSDPT